MDTRALFDQYITWPSFSMDSPDPYGHCLFGLPETTYVISLA